MLAFGYVRWDPRSGRADRADTDFVVHQGGKQFLRVRQLAGEHQQSTTDGSDDSFLNVALNVGAQVEEDRDAIGSPHDLALRCVELKPDLSEDALMAAFISGYFQTEDNLSCEDFLERLNEQPQTTTATAGPSPYLETPAGFVGETEYCTPGGSRYICRTVGGLNDVQVLATAIEHGMHVALVGEPGSGKTTLAQVAAPNLVQYQFFGQSTVDDVVGGYIPDPSQPSGFGWRDGPLLIAMRTGRPFLADELARAPHEVQAVLFSVCDHRRSYTALANPHIGEVLAKPGFAVIVTYNPGTGFGIEEALLDRIAFTITVPTDLDAAGQLGVPEEFVKAARALRTASLVANTKGTAPVWVPTLRSLLQARDLAAVFGMRFAASALVSACPEETMRPGVLERLNKELNLGSGALGELTAQT